MARRRKTKTRLFYIFIITLMLILSAILVYVFIIKDRVVNDAAIDNQHLRDQVEDELLPVVEDADLKETDQANLEPGSLSAAEDDPDRLNSLLMEIEDGDNLFAPVNKQTTLKPDYEPQDLRSIPEYMNPDRQMQLREPALRMLVALWHAAQFDGISLKVISAYRSYAYQGDLFQRYADNYGEEEANLFSARPGQSEHQLGTTVDFGGTAADLTAAFADTPQGLWLADHAHLFGFVMSYPEGSTEITGYIFEPWHFRYIGIEAALDLKRSGLTLTEYLNRKYVW
jgi:zinc D-Ala-D-Ala carboxypeptidase